MYDNTDYLSITAKAKHSAKSAIKNKKFNDAWKHLEEQKDNYNKHARRFGWDQRQSIALAATVSEDYANIFRLEGKHNDALFEIIYWVACTPKNTQSQFKKLTTYYKRAKLPDTSISEVIHCIDESRVNLNPILIKNKILEWTLR